MNGKEKDAPTRRDFLKLAAAGAPAVAVVASTGAAEARETQERGEGLRETAHVRAYYESARF